MTRGRHAGPPEQERCRATDRDGKDPDPATRDPVGAAERSVAAWSELVVSPGMPDAMAVISANRR